MFLLLFLRKIISFFNDYIEIIALFVETIKSIFINRGKGKFVIIDGIIKQVYFSGVHALLVMSFVSLLIGVVIIFICNSYGLDEKFISDVLISTIIQYVGPLITMMVLIGRSGTAIAAEIGNMKVAHEIEALEVMGIDVIHFIALPRIVGMTISIFCLSIFFTLISILGSAFVMVKLLDNFSLFKFYQVFFNKLQITMFLENILKVIGFGIIISTVSCYQGFKVRFSALEVPQRTTQAVGRSIILCFIYFVYISVIFTYID